jgi:ubiquinone/menaquinone biosynthesis C-methylase UbiE
LDVREASKILADLGDDPEFLEKELQRHDPIYEALIEIFEVRPGSKVLELGCGTGAVTTKLAQRTGPKTEIIAIDVNRGMLTVAKEKKRRLGLSNVDFRLMNMEDLNFPDETFDFVISSFGVCCCFFYNQALGESYRVLKHGGKLAFSQDGPNRYGAEELVERVFSKFKTNKPSETLAKKIEANELHESLTSKYQGRHQDPFAVLALMQEVGFRDVECLTRYFRISFRTPAEYLDYSMFNSLGFREMGPRKQGEFRRDCIAALKAIFMTDEGLVANQEVLQFTGTR